MVISRSVTSGLPQLLEIAMQAPQWVRALVPGVQECFGIAIGEPIVIDGKDERSGSNAATRRILKRKAV